MIQQRTNLDTAIDDIHRVREQMAAEIGGDLNAILEDARKRQEASGCAVWRGPSQSNAISPGGEELPLRISEIRDLLRKQPFRPFTIHLADGREFPIEHVDFLLISRSERSFVVAELDGGYEIIDPMMVTSLSVSEATAESA